MNYFSSVLIAQRGFKVEEVDGVIVVSNPKHPIPDIGLKKRIIFKEELSIGVIEGDENYMFGDRISFNTDKEGNFYVSDLHNKRILKYDPQGKYLLTIGRAGQGPGEFESLSIAQFDKDNNLYVTDRRSKRISFFDNTGKLFKEISIPAMFDAISINKEDFILAKKFERIREGGIAKGLEKFGLFDKKLNPITILKENKLEPFISIMGGDINKQIKSYANSISKTAFQPHLIYSITDKDFIYFGYPREYEINICSPEGKLMKKIRRDYEPIPVNKKDRAAVIKRYNDNPVFARRFPEEIRRKIFDALNLRKYKPAYQTFTLMENGWLCIIVDSIENEYSIFDLFDQEGRYIANFKTTILKTPAAMLNLFFKNGRAYAVAEEEGFPFVKRYAIELQEYKNKKWVKSSIKLY